MRTLYVTEFITLDGVIDSPGGDEGHPHAGWSFKDVTPLPEVYEMKTQEQEEAGALMLGRASYDLFAPVWPSMTTEFPRYNAMPKYVVSTTLQEDELVDNWGEITILRSMDDVAAVKETEGGPISVHASSRLAHSLAAADLVDRYHLLVFPIVLGSGKRLWDDTSTAKHKLSLAESQSYGNGVQKLIYDVVR
ncbi:dihydrofolate reductase family protein [Nocardioides bizhenqiangii]|uniref:Dihydrofolate reductase family protein n=1 Tax=Nocardioides bizhenqiangii TaxID=3095076 RepID=A0ABZ0ZMS7_9ACTN|nr:dihydrofolate reductase family protein [Nocardioides sp. HM61]WQQ24902.1 dihydrofolate reductase family protein [Nocardioides sp. HM61]